MQWSIVLGNRELPLTGRNPFDLVSAQGIGVAPVRRLTERGPFQDGDSDIGFRLDPRTINLVLFFAAANEAQADGYRDTLANYFQGLNRSLALRCQRADGQTRQIDCYVAGMVDLPIDDRSRIGDSQKVAVQLRAPDPIWYDPQPKFFGLMGGGSTGASGFRVPVTVPWQMVAQTYIETAFPLSYPGSWAAYPIITVYGPASNVTIQNQTTGDVLLLPYLGLAGGAWLQIDLRYGRKTVVDNTGANRISELSDDSDLATFHLAADPEAEGGVNTIRFAVSAAASNATGLQLEFYGRYVAA
jgi:hypothetical protein